MYIFFFLFFCSGGGATSPSAEASSVTQEQEIPVVILKVDGTGIPRVRKKIGTSEGAAARGELLAGDRLITDERSAVYLMLNDGTVIKLGIKSELFIERIELDQKSVIWELRLKSGSVRVLSEASPTSSSLLRLKTDNGFISARGAEYVVLADAASNSTTVFLIAGNASFGSDACEKTNACLEMKKGEASFLSQKIKVAEAKPFAVKELFRSPGLGHVLESPINLDVVLSLFVSSHRSAETIFAKMNEAELSDLMSRSREEISSAQDRAIGRDKKQREEMQRSATEEPHQVYLEAADAYAKAMGVFDPETNGRAENFVCQALASKLRLGQAVVRAEKARVFSDSTKPGAKLAFSSDRSFRIRKNFDYATMAEAKSAKDALPAALQDYRATLEYLEAMPAGEPDGEPSKGQPSRGASLLPKKPRSCDLACRAKNVAQMIRIASEGSVKAFQEKKAMPAPQRSGVAAGFISTPYFSRVIPGNGCFRKEKTCKKALCAPKTRGCEQGVRDVCVVKEVPIKCPASRNE